MKYSNNNCNTTNNSKDSRHLGGQSLLVRSLSASLIASYAMIALSIFAFLSGQRAEAQELDADAIIRRIDNNRVIAKGIEGSGTMSITDRYGTRVSTFDYIAKGSDFSLINFTSSSQLGQKVLRREEKIYLYYPDAEDIITLNQSMFQQSFMDSDLSFEDIAGDKTIAEVYSPKYERTEVKNGYESHVIYLSAFNPRKESYSYQRIWVEVNTDVIIYAELFTRREKLLKTLEVGEYMEIDGVYVVTDTVFRDALKKNSSTKFLLSDVSITDISESEFSLEELRF